MQQTKNTMKKETDLKLDQRKFVSDLQQKIVFIYKMKQIRVKNHGKPVKIVVKKVGMRIALYFCKGIEYPRTPFYREKA